MASSLSSALWTVVFSEAGAVTVALSSNSELGRVGFCSAAGSSVFSDIWRANQVKKIITAWQLKLYFGGRCCQQNLVDRPHVDNA